VRVDAGQWELEGPSRVPVEHGVSVHLAGWLTETLSILVDLARIELTNLQDSCPIALGLDHSEPRWVRRLHFDFYRWGIA